MAEPFRTKIFTMDDSLKTNQDGNVMTTLAVSLTNGCDMEGMDRSLGVGELGRALVGDGMGTRSSPSLSLSSPLSSPLFPSPSTKRKMASAYRAKWKKEMKEEMERKELERKETGRKEMERKELEREEAMMETERKETERKETERKKTERKETERKEMERREMERRGMEWMEAEQRRMERRESERREMVRKEIERKKSERMEMERMETERKRTERKEAERKKTEKKETERKETERKESERKVMERKETERKEMDMARKDMERKEMKRKETVWEEKSERKETEMRETERKGMERKETERKEMERKEILERMERDGRISRSVGIGDSHSYGMRNLEMATQLVEAREEIARLKGVIKRMSLDRIEMERKEIERKETERKELERKESERKEIERENTHLRDEIRRLERKETERKESERKVIERKETERKELERKENERKETERKEMERSYLKVDAVANIAQSKRMGSAMSEGSNASPPLIGEDLSLPPLPQRITRNLTARIEGDRRFSAIRAPHPMVNRGFKGVETGREAYKDGAITLATERKETERKEVERKETERKETTGFEDEWRVVARRSGRGSGVEDDLSSPPLPPRPLRKRELIVAGFYETVGTAEIMEALCYAGGCPEEDIRMGPIRTRTYGLSTVWVQLPVAAALMAAEKGRILIGRTAARVELLKARPLQCFKCWAFGHMRDACRSVANRWGACYKCGKKGHIARECENLAHCAVCFDAGKKAHHRLGGPLCAAQERHRELLERKEFGKESGKEGLREGRSSERKEFWKGRSTERKEFGKDEIWKGRSSERKEFGKEGVRISRS